MIIVDTGFDNTKPAQSTPEISLQQKKEHVWNNLIEEFQLVTDGLGQRIEGGILESVVAFNALGIPTRQSCEGHADRISYAPFLEFHPNGSQKSELEKERDRVRTQADDAWEHQTLSPEETDKLESETNRLSREIDIELVRNLKKVFLLLEEFYKDKSVPFDRRLILEGNRLKSQGSYFQVLEEEASRKVKLGEYQDEMRAFTQFAKGKFFLDETPIEPAEELNRRLESERIAYEDEQQQELIDEQQVDQR